MPLPASGPITFGDINSELGRALTNQIDMNDSQVRSLFGKAGSGTAISMSDGLGKQVVYSVATLITSSQNWTVPSGAYKVKFHLIGGGGGGRTDNGAGGLAYYGQNGTSSTISFSGSTIMTAGRGGGGGQNGSQSGVYGGTGSVQGGIAGTASGGNVSNTGGSVGVCTASVYTYTSYSAGTINGNTAYNGNYLRNNYGYGGATASGCGGTGGSNYAGGSAAVCVSEFFTSSGAVYTITIGAGGSAYSYAGTAYNGGNGACLVEYAT